MSVLKVSEGEAAVAKVPVCACTCKIEEMKIPLIGRESYSYINETTHGGHWLTKWGGHNHRSLLPLFKRSCIHCHCSQICCPESTSAFCYRDHVPAFHTNWNIRRAHEWREKMIEGTAKRETVGFFNPQVHKRPF